MIGPRLVGPFRTLTLDYGRPGWALRMLAVPSRWMLHVGRGGLVIVAVCLNPMPVGGAQDAVIAQAQRAGAHGRVYTVVTYLRTSSR